MSDCTCGCHINPRDFVPVCRNHHLPLRAAEAGYGECPWRGGPVKRIGGQDFARLRCVSWHPSSWAWLPRELFNADDLPPLNGDRPPNVDKHAGPRWNVKDDGLCLDCGVRTPHAYGENRAVCLSCGVATWRVDPAYV